MEGMTLLVGLIPSVWEAANQLALDGGYCFIYGSRYES